MIKNAGVAVLVVFTCLFWNAASADPFFNTGQQVQLEQVAGHELLRAFTRNGNNITPQIISLTRVIFQDKAGIFWFGGPHGLCTYDEKQDKWIDYTNALGKGTMTWVHTIGQDQHGRIWVYHDKQFTFLDGSHWRDVSEILPPNIKSLSGRMIAGRDGKMWFVSLQGIIVYDGLNWAGPFNPPEGIQQRFVQIKPIDENSAGAVNTKKPSKEIDSDQLAPQLWTSEVWSGLQDRDGALWLGGINTLLRFDERAMQWEVYPAEGLNGLVSNISEDRYGRLWFADGSSNLAVYDKLKKVWSSYNLGQRFPQIKPRAETVYVDKQGQVLIGIEPGIVVVSQRNNEMTPLLAAKRDSFFYWVTVIKEDNQGRIWIASYDGISILKQ